MVDRIDDLPIPARNQLLEHLRSINVIDLTEAEKFKIWNKLVDKVSEHRRFADSNWAMNPKEIDEIALIAGILAPSSLTYRFQRLFSDRDYNLFEELENYDVQFKKLEIERQNAVLEILSKFGERAVIDFSQSVESPWRVGIAYGVVAETGNEACILPPLLDSATNAIRQFSGGFVWGRFRSLGWDWVDAKDMSLWLPSQIGQFLAYLPFCLETWERVNNLLFENEELYWTIASVNPYENTPIQFAIDPLIENDRAYSALRCIDSLLHKKHIFTAAQLIAVLDAILITSEKPNSLDTNSIVEIIKILQEDKNANPDNLLRIEWSFLALLVHDDNAYPKLLEQKLSEDPSFFCEIIRLVYKSTKEDVIINASKEIKSDNILNGYRLLNNWRTAPGCRKDGTFDGEKFLSWIDDVKELSLASGHFEVALINIGQVLIFTPADPDGLWLHRVVASILDAKDSKDLREGFEVKLINTRGVHTWTAGKEEYKLSQIYLEKAKELEINGFHRIAMTMRDIANKYAFEAEREASRDISED